MDAKSRFKAVRMHYGLSMRSFGEKIGLTASGVSAIEYGTRALSEKHIKLIRAAFPEISEDWLRSGDGDMLIAAPCAPDDQSAIIPEILRAYSRLTPENQAAFMRYLDFLVADQEHANSLSPSGKSDTQR